MSDTFVTFEQYICYIYESMLMLIDHISLQCILFNKCNLWFYERISKCWN